MPLAYVSQFLGLLGHAQLTTTSRYIQASRLGMQEWMKRVEQNPKNAESPAQTLHTGQPFPQPRPRKSLHQKVRALSSAG